MEFVYNSLNLKALVAEAIKPSTPPYTKTDLYFLTKVHPNLTFKTIEISLKDRKIQVAIYSLQGDTQVTSWILYAHGHSSSAMEGALLMPHIKQGFGLCLMDLRAHGRDSAATSTFGLEEAEEIAVIAKQLKSELFAKSIIVWGRSMGAVAAIRASTLTTDISLVVADSAFSSAVNFTTQLINSKLFIPTFLAESVSEFLIKQIRTDFAVDLELLNIAKLSRKTPTIFIYSKKDQIIRASHSELLFSTHQGTREAIEIQLGHSDKRSEETIQRVFSKISQLFFAMKTPTIVKRQGISLNQMKKLRSSVMESNRQNQVPEAMISSAVYKDHSKRPSSQQAQLRLQPTPSERRIREASENHMYFSKVTRTKDGDKMRILATTMEKSNINAKYIVKSGNGTFGKNHQEFTSYGFRGNSTVMSELHEKLNWSQSSFLKDGQKQNVSRFAIGKENRDSGIKAEYYCPIQTYS